MKKYVVTAEGFLDGKFRRLGEVVEYSDKQAKYLLMAKSIAPHVEKPAAPEPAESAPKKKG